MTLAEIKDEIMFQHNDDAEDVGDYLPHLLDYINEGYDRLMSAWEKNHIPVKHERLSWDFDVPALPEWTHRAICDWATWLIYRNGNPQKQQRGMAFRAAFEDILHQIADEGGAEGINEDGTRKQYKYFRNIPR